MSQAIPINLPLYALVNSVSVTAITRSDTSAPPAGITLPIALAALPINGGVYPWIGSFNDTAPPPYYNAIGNAGSGSFNFTIFGSAQPAGMYATLAMVNQIYSVANVSRWSVIPETGVPDVSFQQGCFNRADNDIISALTMQYFALPAPGASPQATNLAWIEAELMGVYLYEANGLQDANPKGLEGKLEAHRESAMSQLQELMYLNRGQFTRVTGYSDAPLDVQPTMRPDGTPVSDLPLWPRPYWSGNFWVFGGTACNPIGTTFTNRG